MEVEEIKEETLEEEKPKTTKRIKKNPEEITEQVSKIKKSPKKARKLTKKKTTSTTKKKTTLTLKNNKVVEDNINLESSNTETTAQTVKSAAEVVDWSESQPMGQAELPDNKAEVYAKNSENKGDQNPKTDQSQEPTEKLIPNAVLGSANPVHTGSSKVEIAQTTVLPLTAIRVRNIIGTVKDLVTEIIPNKVIVQGTIHDQLFFVGNDGVVHYLAGDTNFSTFLDIPGVQAGMNANVSAVIQDTISDLAPDGLSILKKIVLEVFVEVSETVQLNLEAGNGPILVLNRVVGNKSAQTLLESDLILFTPAIRIDEIIGSIRDLTIETINDQVIVQGTLHQQIFFIDTTNLGRHQAEDLSFNLVVNIPGVTSGMDVQIQPRIEAIFFNLVSPTVVHQKTMLEFLAKVTESIMQQVTVGSGPLLRAAEYIGENTVQQLSETVVTLNSPAVKIREIVASTQNLVSNVIPNKVIVEGVLHKQIYFIGTDNIEHHQAEDVPFSLFLDIPGATLGNIVNLTTNIEAIFFDLFSSTELRDRVIISVNGVVSEEVQLNLVVGVGPLFKVEQVIGENTKQLLVLSNVQIVQPLVITTKKPLGTSVKVDPSLENVIGSQQILLQNSFPLSVQAIKVKEVDPAVTNVSFQVIADGVMVTGAVNKSIVFVGTDNIVRSIDEQIPFSILVKILGVTPAQILNSRVQIEDVIFNLDASGNAVNQTVVLRAEVIGQELLREKIPAATYVTGPGISKNVTIVRSNR